MTNQIPSVDPVDLDSLVGAFRFILKKNLQQNVDAMLPAQVIAYDATTNRVTVQPMIKITTTGGEEVSRAQIASLPVYQIGNSQWQLTFPIQPGDFGWIAANDRDISLYLQSGQFTALSGSVNYTESPPNTERLHSFSDAVFFPDCMNNGVPIDLGAPATIWQSKDASTYIGMITGKISIQAVTTTVTGQLMVYGDTEISGAVQLLSSLAVQGNFGCNGVVPQGKITVNGPATTNGETTTLVNQLRAALIAYGICQ